MFIALCGIRLNLGLNSVPEITRIWSFQPLFCRCLNQTAVTKILQQNFVSYLCQQWTEYAKCLSHERQEGIAAIFSALCCMSRFNCVCPCEDRQGIMYTWLSCISLSEGVCFVSFQRKQRNTDTNGISSTENPMSFTYHVSSGRSERLGVGVQVVSSAGFLPYRLFSSLFKCRNVFYEVYWQENLTLKPQATNTGSEE